MRQNAPVRLPIARAGPPTPTPGPAGLPRQIAPLRDDSRLPHGNATPRRFLPASSVPHLPGSPLPPRARKRPTGPRARCEPLTRYPTTAPFTSMASPSVGRSHPHRRRLPRKEHPSCQTRIVSFHALICRHALAKPGFRPAIATLRANSVNHAPKVETSSLAQPGCSSLLAFELASGSTPSSERIEVAASKSTAETHCIAVVGSISTGEAQCMAVVGSKSTPEAQCTEAVGPKSRARTHCIEVAGSISTGQAQCMAVVGSKSSPEAQCIGAPRSKSGKRGRA